VIELGSGCAKAGLDVSQALSVGELSKGHAKILVPAGKALHLVIPPILFHAPMEFVGG
jgi:hypothetical protein